MNNELRAYNYLVELSKTNTLGSLIRYRGNDFEMQFLQFVFERAKKSISIYYKNVEESMILSNQLMHSYIKACANRNVDVRVLIVGDKTTDRELLIAPYRDSAKQPLFNFIKKDVANKVTAEKAHFIVADDCMYGLEYSQDAWIASLDSRAVVASLNGFIRDFLLTNQ